MNRLGVDTIDANYTSFELLLEGDPLGGDRAGGRHASGFCTDAADDCRMRAFPFSRKYHDCIVSEIARLANEQRAEVEMRRFRP